MQVELNKEEAEIVLKALESYEKEVTSQARQLQAARHNYRVTRHHLT